MAAHTSVEFRCNTAGCVRYGQVTAVDLHAPAGARGQGLLAIPQVICDGCGQKPARLLPHLVPAR